METLNIITDKQVIANVKVGNHVNIYHFVNLYGCTIDDNSKIGTFVEIQKNATVGKNCKISSHTFICEGVHIKDNVFVGHGVTFINDRIPRATTKEGKPQTEKDWVLEETIVKQGASVGSGATIMCGIEIGENAVIGAGAVVTKDVPANSIVAGNPAKVIGTV